MTTSVSLRTVVAFGDSITAGHQIKSPLRWTDLLQTHLQQNWAGSPAPTVINAGVGGNNTNQGLARIERDVLPHLPALVLVEFGNDASPIPPRHVPLTDYQTNMHAIHQFICNQGGRVMFMSFPPVVDAWRPTPGGDQRHAPYRAVVRQVAQSLDCPFFDLENLLREAGMKEGWDQYFIEDGVHLTEKAHRLVAQALAPRVRDLLGTSNQPTQNKTDSI